MARQPEGPPPPPVVQRLRVRYAKRGRLRFTSHRDFARAFERAVRRAGLPIAFSAGFTPHPKVSYAGAAPTGVASEAEYLEIGLAERREPAAVRAALDAALPPGLDILEVVEAAGPGFGERIAASRWEVRLPEVEPALAQACWERFLALDSCSVDRPTKDGHRSVDARAAVLAGRVTAGTDGSCAILDLVVRHTTPAVRPDDVLTALRQAVALPTPVTPQVTRLAQGLLVEVPPAPAAATGLPDLVRLTDPLASDAAATE